VDTESGEIQFLEVDRLNGIDDQCKEGVCAHLEEFLGVDVNAR
jgi:hypothetical protein